MILEGLNEQQALAASTLDGPVLVVAGAGSGKTKVLTSRIAHLIAERKAFPDQILAFTFTNKAAAEMKTRIEAMRVEGAHSMWIGTFHAICVRILRRGAELLGYNKNFVIYDVADQRALLKNIIKEMGIDPKVLTPNEVQSLISRLKNDRTGPDEFEKSGYGLGERAEIYRRYQRALKANNAFDFDDLINATIQLLQENESIRDGYRKRFRYIHVDEYQDTNKSQYLLIRLLVDPAYNNLFVVGDADQSIYKWRGADIRNIRDFEADFPGATVVMLEQNYRSTGNILDLANSVIEQNPDRRKKALWTAGGEGDLVRYYNAHDDREEATFVAREIRSLRDTDRGEICVLYRTNAQSRPFEEAFRREGIAFKIVGGLKFFDRKEVKDVLAYLRLIVNPSDDISFERVVNEPKRQVGDTSLQRAKDFASNHVVSLMDAVMHPEFGRSGVTKAALNGMTSFVTLIRELSEMRDGHTALEIFDALLDKTRMIALYEQQNTMEADSRIDNIYELRNAIEEAGHTISLDEFLAEAALRSDQDNISEEEAQVLMMTLHTSKGLEYDVIFLTGLEDGLFPSLRSLEERDGVEEERRLCYVGITRARKVLYLTHARSRMLYGRPQATIPSRFLKEMDHAKIDSLSSIGIERVKGTPKETQQTRHGRWGAPPIANPWITSGTGYASGGYGSGDSQSGSVPASIGARFSGGASSNASSNRGAKPSFAAGDKVRHDVFGDGTVINTSADGSVLTIAFDGAGMKKLNPDYAPMKKRDSHEE
ncbi:MAG: UvrD-helicase domain-containing protein [Bacillota bacterium]|nr:UvrD-helicase domain-containing protein [Bacillota bacterium]